MKSKYILRQLALPIASLLIHTTAHAAVVDTTGTTVTYTAPQDILNTEIIGDGTLDFDGSGVIGLDNSGGGNPVTFAMIGGIITVQTGVTLQNGGWQGGIWTNNFSSLALATGATLDLWDGNPVRVNALTGNGTVTISTIPAGVNGLGGTSLTLGVNGGSGKFTGSIAGNTAVDGGPVSITKEGAGTQTLAGSNTYSGDTTINNGILQIGDGGTSGNLGNGDTTNNAELVFNRSDASSYSGVISGSGSVTKEGAGTQTLTGPSIYSGVTTVNAGKLRFLNQAPNSSGILAIASNAALEINVTTTQVELGKTGGTTVSGAGTFVKSGTGLLGLDEQGGNHGVTFNLTGGLIDIQGGVLRNGGWDGGIWTNNKASLNIAAGAALDPWGGQPIIVDALTGEGTVMIAPTFGINWAGVKSLTLGINGGTGTFAGNIAGNGAVDGGSVSITKEGSGTQTLTGTNTYNGDTTINNGILQIGDGGTSGSLGMGDITNNAELIFNRSDASSYNGVISGLGSVTKEGAGMQTLTGPSIYSGVTTVNAGKLRFINQIPNSSGTLTIASNATLEINVTSVQEELGKTGGTTISGAGTFVKSGTGLLGLDEQGGNHGVTFNLTGGLIDIQGGVLRNGGWDGGIWTNNKASLNIAAGATLDPWGGQPVIVDALTGEGTVMIAPAFGVNWAGVKSLTLGINGGSGTFAGNIAGNGAVDGGSVSITKEGAGTQTLTGTNTYNGTTTINGGTLVVTGSLANTDVTVNSPATLAGNGNIGGNVTITSGATLALAVGVTADTQITRAITGTLTLTNSILNLTAATTPAAGVYVLATASTAIIDSPATINYNGISGTVSVDSSSSPQRLLLTVGGSPYETWSGGIFANPFTNKLPTADPDADGQTNQQEFAFGLDPTTGSSVNPIAQQLDRTSGTFKYTRTKDSGLNYKIYYSTNLSSWNLNASAIQVPATAIDGVETVTVTLVAVAPVDSKLFVRVEASSAP
jgi:autotransporter-associated beta strand protein